VLREAVAARYALVQCQAADLLLTVSRIGDMLDLFDFHLIGFVPASRR
jgi:hypothetical protein